MQQIKVRAKTNKVAPRNESAQLLENPPGKRTPAGSGGHSVAPDGESVFGVVGGMLNCLSSRLHIFTGAGGRVAG
jgi:hypothetical protein